MFKIDAGFIIWCCIMLAVCLLLLACWNEDRRARRRTDREQLMAQQMAERGGQRTRYVQQVKLSPAPLDEGSSETRHWCALGLNKLGYSMPTARALAAKAPCDQGVEHALTWCLRNNGGTHK
jgi:hypothetical protein